MMTRLYEVATLVLAVTSIGCYAGGEPVYNTLVAFSQFDSTKRDIKQTQTEIAVHGHIVDEAGEPLRGLDYYSKEDLGFGTATVLITIGWRDHAHLGGDPEGPERPCSVETIGHNFDIKMSKTQKLTLIILKVGYEPEYVDVIVPRALEGHPPPISVEKTIVLHRSASATQPVH